MPLPHALDDSSSSSRCPPDVCVAAVLGDPRHRLVVLGGREGMPRSLGSVYGGAVTCFLGGSFRGVVSRVIGAPAGAMSLCTGVAVSVDGSTLLLSARHASGPFKISVHELIAADGSLGCVPGGWLPQFSGLCHVCIAPDGFVFVANCVNHRVQVLTPDLDVHCTIGQGLVRGPAGVCANADVVVVSEYHVHRIAVFNRGDGALLRRFGSLGDGDGELSAPRAVWFMSGGRHVAVLEAGNNRVSVFTIDGEFIRHIGVGLIGRIFDMAVSAFDEIVVSDRDRCGLRVFSSDGDLLATAGDGVFTAVTVHGSSVLAAHDGLGPPGILSVFE